MRRTPAPPSRDPSRPISARMILTFPSMVETTARISNAVLVVNFSEPVQVAQIERIASQMPSYVSLARVDPDGRGVRFALTRNLRVNKLAAAERVFIDLLPPTWQGMPPSLPQEVVTELARRVQAAESQARTVARQVRQEVRDIDVRVSQLPTLVRLVFVLPQEAIVDAAMRDGGIDVGIGRGFRFEPARLRPLLPPDVALAPPPTRMARSGCASKPGMARPSATFARRKASSSTSPALPGSRCRRRSSAWPPKCRPRSRRPGRTAPSRRRPLRLPRPSHSLPPLPRAVARRPSSPPSLRPSAGPSRPRRRRLWLSPRRRRRRAGGWTFAFRDARPLPPSATARISCWCSTRSTALMRPPSRLRPRLSFRTRS